MATDVPMLPPAFADLEPFAEDWVHETERGRYDKRLASTMEELQAFYDAFYPRALDALDFLDALDIDDLPDDALNLLRLCYSLSTISFAVDCFQSPRIPDSGSAYLDIVTEPVP
jgi:hypothetical protein